MSKQTKYDKIKLLGVEVDAYNIADAISYICELAAGRKRSAYVIKPYVEFLDRAARDSEVRELLNNAELSLADGIALIWSAHFLYAGPRTVLRFWGTLMQIVLTPDKLRWPLPDRTSGTNFTWPLLRRAKERELRVFLIGKRTPEEIEAVSKVISDQVPGLEIAGTRPGLDPAARSGVVSDGWLEETADAVRHAKADLVLVGMGFPLQERVCAYLTGHVKHGVFIGEGGTFDYESFGGPRRKAPAWLQRIGLEWLWRLMLEPSRARRQLAVPRFIRRIWQTRRS